jgi:Fungal Zn(2)-Cys(6) binuclear cluster domain
MSWSNQPPSPDSIYSSSSEDFHQSQAYSFNQDSSATTPSSSAIITPRSREPAYGRNTSNIVHASPTQRYSSNMAPSGIPGYPAHMTHMTSYSSNPSAQQQQQQHVEYAQQAPMQQPNSQHSRLHEVYTANHGAYTYATDDAYNVSTFSSVSDSLQRSLIPSSLFQTMVGYGNVMQPMQHIGELGKDGKPKRKQVRNACTNCQKACKKCDEGRPCSRCVKYGLTDTCENSVRKERKRGIKRGPYKRRNKHIIGVMGSTTTSNAGMAASAHPFAFAHRTSTAPNGVSLPPLNTSLFTNSAAHHQGMNATVVSSAPSTVQRSPMPLDAHSASNAYHYGAMSAPGSSPYVRTKQLEHVGYATQGPISRQMYSPQLYTSNSTPVSVASTPTMPTFLSAHHATNNGNGVYTVSRPTGINSMQQMVGNTASYSTSNAPSSSPVPSFMGHHRLHSDGNSSLIMGGSASSNGSNSSVYSPRTPLSAIGGLPPTSSTPAGYNSSSYISQQQGAHMVAQQQQQQQAVDNQGKPFMLKLPPAPRNRIEQMPSAEEMAHSRPAFLNLPHAAANAAAAGQNNRWAGAAAYGGYGARFDEVPLGMKASFAPLPPLQGTQ